MEGQDLRELCQHLLEDVAASTRLLLSGHPALGRLVIDLAPETSPPGYTPADAVAPVPVVLVEPMRTGQVLAAPGVPAYDVRTAIAAKLGLPVLTARPSAPSLAANWTLEYGQTTCVLTDPTGSALARCRVANQPRWRDFAGRLGKVVVIYGPSIGVRRPGGMPKDRYDDHARAAELSHARATGTANWGIVQFISR